MKNNSQKQPVNAWERLGITERILYLIQSKIELSFSGKEQLYWMKSKSFIMDLQHKTYEQLSYKQRNWAKDILSELKIS